MDRFKGNSLECVRGERMVFSGLDFEVEAGGALVLTGADGSGKSSLLRVMSGLLRPSSGAITWDGEPVANDPEAHHARLHFVGHLDAVKPVLTVAENLAFWADLNGSGASQDVEAALRAFGIAHLAEVPGRFLSAGQRRRVNLARILAVRAPLWLLDEPTTALDREGVAALERAVAGHCEHGGMAVIATHTEMALNAPRLLDLDRFRGPGVAA